MSQIQLQNLTVNFDDHFWLHNIDWQIEPGQHWAIVGSNGSGKSALAALLHSAGDIEDGSATGLPKRVGIVSMAAQSELIEAERQKDDADILDIIPEGTPVKEVLDEECEDHARQQQLIDAFKFSYSLERSFRKLSTGETRKVLIIKALTCNADLLVLDEPFEGLDIESVTLLSDILDDLAKETPTVFVLNRFDEIPDYVTHIAYTNEARLEHRIARSDEEALADLHQLLHLQTTDLSIPPRDPFDKAPELADSDPLFKVNNARIAYGEKVIFENLDWKIDPGQHWQVTGPNGSGKTCLLNLITGDHPQCYVNDIFVFGMQRGNGESIWDIKQHIGYVSSALQWEYKVSVSVRNAIISGFYDSIGLYQKYTDHQKDLANQWLDLMGMSERANAPFSQLSFGDQRLVLIARAMVKHPPLLILDEPCLGLDDINRQLVLSLIEKICVGSTTTVL